MSHDNRPTNVIRVAIVDDHPMVREGLRAFLSFAEDIEIIFVAETGEEALLQATKTVPDVVLMDLVMPGAMDGLLAIRKLTQTVPSVKTIALTSFQEPERILAALDAGAIGYLQKDVNPTDLLGAIRQAAAGRAVLEPTAFAALQTLARGNGSKTQPTRADGEAGSGGLIEPLTAREQEVLESLATGLSNKEIASTLAISEKTVKVHVSHILSKLGVYDRTQALVAAAKLGLIQLGS